MITGVPSVDEPHATGPELVVVASNDVHEVGERATRLLASGTRLLCFVTDSDAASDAALAEATDELDR